MLFSLKINKSSGYDDISFNAVRNYFGPLLKPFMHVFSLSMEKGIFLDDLKTAWVTPIFKAGDKSEMGNYRPISVLPCFSKILKRITYNRFKYLTANEILYKKQLGFREGHSMEHGINQRIDQIKKCWEKSLHSWCLYWPFKSIQHWSSILIKKSKSTSSKRRQYMLVLELPS